jgi:hypothetical protein
MAIRKQHDKNLVASCSLRCRSYRHWKRAHHRANIVAYLSANVKGTKRRCIRECPLPLEWPWILVCA